MHIKQVIIEGFKSYREQVATEEFSPKHNCVVGANGSGKTNFFHAIRFVLGDLFQNLRAEDRQALLHEGAGHQVHSAFVEIVFENSDNRMPVDRDEVRLRRTIGKKSDEYYLDSKRITKNEVMNLLESAGFSRSNPYYVVQQGKIASLTLMKDSERLDLLKEIGGTRVYEERRKESLKIMQDSDTRRKQIEDVVQYIEERLKELDEEKEELNKYQQLDKQRRSLEYTIFDKELAESKQALEEVDYARSNLSRKSSQIHNQLKEAKEKLKTAEKELKTLMKQLQALQKEKLACEEGRNTSIRTATRIRLDIRDLEEKLRTEGGSKDELEQELLSLNKEIAAVSEEVKAVELEQQRILQVEEDLIRRVGERERQLKTLLQKKSRSSQFSDTAERNKHLAAEIQKLQSTRAQKEAQVHKFQEEISGLEDSVKLNAEAAKQKEEEVKQQDALLGQCRDNAAQLKDQRDQLHEKRLALRKSEAELMDKVKELKQEIGKADKRLENNIPPDIRRALQSVRRLVKDHNLHGVHGPILELIRCDEKFFVPVEVTAGTSLFHVVVDDDQISSRIIQYLNNEKGGRCTFVPLNKLRCQKVQYPNNPDAIPLVKKLQYESRFGNAFHQIFGKTVLCRDLDVATAVSRQSDLDSVTMEGDQVNKKGALTGGYSDSTKSRLALMRLLQEGKGKLDDLEEQLRPMSKELQELEQDITRVVSEQQKLDTSRHLTHQKLEDLRAELKQLHSEEGNTRRMLNQKGKFLREVREGIVTVESTIAGYQEEMRTPITSTLTSEELQLLESLNPEIATLRSQLKSCQSERFEMDSRHSMLEAQLSTNLLKRREELQAQIGGMSAESWLEELIAKKVELQEAEASAQERAETLAGTLSSIERISKEIRELKGLTDETKSLEDQFERSMQDEAKDLENLVNKRSLLLEKQEEYMKKIRSLGSLPSDAFQKYQDKSLKELHKLLHKCNSQLKNYSHVNKKALDQYVNFTEQREELHKRQEELDKADEKIRELIEVLDLRKDESIERTFKQVAKLFRVTFSELVPHGHGTLVMQKKRRAGENNGDEPDDDDHDEDRAEGAEEGISEKYSGVRVKVSFGQGETQSIKQLSGGQKTVVALALIFAIQRCDPAPFYLFDEIDAALDPQYRTAVGNMIRRQADENQTQFITTTFRPELVKVADRIYGVFHKNRVSTVDVINMEQALHFIEQDQNQQST